MQVDLAGETFDVTTLSWSAPGKGHDRLLVSARFMGVADGATPLHAGDPDPGVLAHHALVALQRAAADARTSAADVWRSAIRTTAASCPSGRRASCSVATVRERGDLLELALLGDCALIATMVDGRLIRLFDTTIAALDTVARHSLFRRRAFRRNRRLLNTPQGYWIFADDPEAANHLQVATVRADQVTAFAILSDGLRGVASSVGAAADDTTVIVAERIPRR